MGMAPGEDENKKKVRKVTLRGKNGEVLVYG
jgi:hypothetical protein